MKVAPVMAAVEAWNAEQTRAAWAGWPPGARIRLEQALVHTGQHYDATMSDVFFDELGLRSFDREMPEELNRLLTDQLAELLFTTSEDAAGHLAHEGVAAELVHFVGNTMIDTLERLRDRALERDTLERLGLAAREYALVTLHRPSNVDDPGQLGPVAELLGAVSRRLPVLFPVHARTRARLAEAGTTGTGSPGGAAAAAAGALDGAHGVRLTGPLGYLDFVAAMAGARFVLTDSGGVQEETTVLGVPCLTLRTSTERPVTLTHGTNRLVDPYDPAAVLAAVDDVLAAPMPSAGAWPPLWDGHAAERIVAVVAEWSRSRAGRDAG